MTLFRRIPLTIKIILLTFLVGIVSWGMLEQLHSRELRSIFDTQLNTQLQVQAQEARVHFDDYIAGYRDAAEIVASQRRFADYLNGRDLSAAPGIKYYDEIPPWMPSRSVMRRLVRISYILLMDGEGHVREVFQDIPEPLPSALLNPGSLLRALSFNQSLMTKVDGIPFVLTAKPVFRDGSGRDRHMSAILMFASPLNDDLLEDSQGFAGGRSIVVLISEGKIIASNRLDILPGGTSLDEVRRRYLLMGRTFFEAGSSDLLIEFASLISRQEYEALGREVVVTGRNNGLMLAMVFVVLFSFVMSRITRRIALLTRRISDFSEKKVGGLPVGPGKGDELVILEKSFEHLTAEVVSTTERLRKARDELELRVEERTAELKKSESFLETIIETEPECVKLLAPDGSLLMMNRAGLAMLEADSLEQIKGRQVLSFVSPEYREAFAALVKQVFKGGSGTLEFEITGLKGRRLWLDTHAVPLLSTEGRVTALLGITRDITGRKKAEEIIKFQAYHDILTGLPNRALFMDRLGLEIAQMQRAGKKVAVLFLDIDHFKNINDSLGHAAGDALLKEVAVQLKACMRETDTIARIGGDEFTIMLPLISASADAAVITEKIAAIFREPFKINEHKLHVTASIGISLYPEDGGTAETLLKNSDIAMYYAKERGRNNYQFFDNAINIRTLERIMLGNRLRQALESGELVVHYQPLMNIRDQKIVGSEALVRWKHPERGLLNPADFIPLAEEIGLIIPIDQWVMRTACVQLKTWQKAGHLLDYVTVNLSARQFQQPDLAEKISVILEETGLSSDSLGVEITESLAMQDTELTVRNLNLLSGMGIKFYIDDFGTGYSSLSYLKKLPIHKLKIDKIFIKNLTLDPDYRAIVNAIITMAHILKLEVLAEGVETEEQMKFLRARHCDEMQGYFYSKPVPAEEFEALMV